MVTLKLSKADFTCLIEGAQPESVVLVLAPFSHSIHGLGVFVSVRESVSTELFALVGVHHRVVEGHAKEHLLEGPEVRVVSSVMFARNLVIQVREEGILAKVLGLVPESDKVVREGERDTPIEQEVIRVILEKGTKEGDDLVACGAIVHPIFYSAHCDVSPYRRIVVLLDVCSYDWAPLAEANGIETACQLGVCANCLREFVDLQELMERRCQ